MTEYKKLGGMTDPFIPDHEQVEVEYFTGEKIHVDKGMKDLLTRIWKLKVPTELSCENRVENCNKFYISFQLEVYQDFLSLLKSKNKNLMKLFHDNQFTRTHLQAFTNKDNGEIRWQAMMFVPTSRMPKIIEEWDKTFD